MSYELLKTPFILLTNTWKMYDEFLTNLIQTFTNILQASYKFLKTSCILLTNTWIMSNEILTNVLQTSYLHLISFFQLLEYFLQIYYEIFTNNYFWTSYNLLKNFLKLLRNFLGTNFVHSVNKHFKNELQSSS